MVGWPHPLDGPEFAQALGDGKDREAWRAAVHGVAKNRIPGETEDNQGFPWGHRSWKQSFF